MTWTDALAWAQENKPRYPFGRPEDRVQYQREMAVWITLEERLKPESFREIHGIVGVADNRPHCAPRSEVVYIPPRPKKVRKTPQKKWAGATREYNAMKQAERRARVRAAVLEVQAERDQSKGRVA